MFLKFYSTYANASMYQGSSCWGFTLLMQLLKSKNSVFASSANMSKLLLLLRWFLLEWDVCETGRQFPIISVADEGLLGEMCFPTGLHYPIILPFGKVRIYGDINTSSLEEVRIKTHRFLWCFGHSCWKKLTNSVDPQGNTSSSQGLRQQQPEIIVEIYAGTRTTWIKVCKVSFSVN